ncbi:MAG: S-layer protein [Verrucomicrobia bacterium]|nr:MAG: S-layer protein [Verrucomicrobiota bacterium]PYJ99740.1 MAG: S-layer protein [Verrucomicrobiota bacterium]
MSFSRHLACFVGSLLLALSGRTAESTATPLAATNITFRNHVQPVLAKMGCSSGACHGAAAGQNGFKLSLRGYDDEGDFLAITRNALGRRIVPADPGRSLLLLKPTTAVPHKGGKRFDVDSLEYKVLSEWIAAGTPGPTPDDPRIDQLQILPEHAVLKPGANQQLLVRAHFSDGRTEDVTRWAKYTAANASVTQVDDDGKVQVVGNGEGAITAWYLSRIAIGTITVPYTNTIAPSVFARAPRRNFIDEVVLEKLQTLNLPPSPRCSDEEFIRRAFLDTLGTLPTADEIRAFLAEGVAPDARRGNKPPDNESASSPRRLQKRDKLIESLLQRPEFVDYWTYKWSDLLLVQSKKLKTPAMWAYYNWIRNNVAANTPWDVFVRKILTAQGSTLENGAGNFYVLHEDPRLMAETTTQAFLGMAVNCAKCHNHPMEKWTNKQYYEFANLFARVRAKTGANDGEDVIFVSNSGDVVQPLTGKRQPPAPLDGNPLPFDDPQDRREALADWLTSPDNPYFSRSIVNRIWANFFGVGIADPVDDLRATNPASNEKLLSAAAKYLADQKFDLKALMRAILQSETYQRSSAPLPGNASDSRFFARYYPRRLMAEVLLDAYSQVTGVPTEFRTDLRNENRGLGEKYPLGFRAIQLPDTKIASYFLKTFGRPDREKTCECERTAEPNVAQMLHIANGDTLNEKLMAKDNQIAKLLVDKTPPEKMVEEAYLSSLSRFPTTAEKKKILQMLNEAKEGEQRPLIEDMYWALLSSKEFLFNH